MVDGLEKHPIGGGSWKLKMPRYVKSFHNGRRLFNINMGPGLPGDVFIETILIINASLFFWVFFYRLGLLFQKLLFLLPFFLFST